MKKYTLSLAYWPSMFFTPAMADIMVHKAQIKLGIGDRPAAMHGVIMNHGSIDTALIGAESPAFSRIELHTHETDANGMMRMMQVDNYALPAMARLICNPVASISMLFDYTGKAGDTVAVTLIFDNGDRKTISVNTKARGKHKGHSGRINRRRLRLLHCR